MDTREDEFRKALAKNEHETEKWQTYRQEQETTMKTLDEFSKNLTVEVMVPIGQKAFMPGHLIRTNEVLVSHYAGYFSECSTHQAKGICEYRINQADEHLEKLRVERELWTNKLDKPYTEHVFPTAGEQEIIEEYDEEKERLWRIEHAKSLKLAKIKEREEREAELQKIAKEKESADEKLLQKLKEAEQVEQQHKELENLDETNPCDELVRNLMAIELSKAGNSVTSSKEDAKNNDFPGIVKKVEQPKENATNNNVRPNPELLEDSQNERDEDDDDDDLVPEEVKPIVEQAKFLSLEEQCSFYEHHIEIAQRKYNACNVRSLERLTEYQLVVGYLRDLIDSIEETLGAQELEDCENNNSVDEPLGEQELQDVEQEVNSPAQKKKRLSFATEDQVLEFKANEAVTCMLPKDKPAKREIIKLDDAVAGPTPATEPEPIIAPVKDRKARILEKVEQSLQNVAQYPRQQDFNLVDAILNGSTQKTIHIQFKHSENPGLAEVEETSEINEIPQNPSDVYGQYCKVKQMEQPEKPAIVPDVQNEIKIPFLKENDRLHAYVDPRAKFSNPMVAPLTDRTNCTQPKSILTNKTAVERETHSTDNAINAAGANKKSKTKTKPKPVDENECLSAYNKVMNEVKEKIFTAPDPLPEGNYIDANAPKKRVSRFKKIRDGTLET